jgi:hypothetical protein
VVTDGIVLNLTLDPERMGGVERYSASGSAGESCWVSSQRSRVARSAGGMRVERITGPVSILSSSLSRSGKHRHMRRPLGCEIAELKARICKRAALIEMADENEVAQIAERDQRKLASLGGTWGRTYKRN